MREQLIQYVNRLFAGSTGAEDIKEQILQDTLDKYDDLLAQGVAPGEAYSQAAEGVGDVQALLDELNPQAEAQGSTNRTDNPVKMSRYTLGKFVHIFVGARTTDSSATQEFRPEETESLEIDWIAGCVKIAAAQQATITVREEFSRGEEPMVVQQSGGRLSVKFSQNNNSYKLITKDKDLFITVPASWSGKRLKLSTVSADVECTDLTFMEAEMKGASGDFSFDACRMETLHVESASGDVDYNGELKNLSVNVASGDLDFTGSLETLDVDSASGDAAVVLRNKPRDLSCHSVSGDLDLTLPENCGFTLKRSTLSGDFDSDFAIAGSSKLGVYGDGACKIELNTVSGDASMHRGQPV